MEEATRDRHERAARNQSMWREINELALTNKKVTSIFRSFICECAAEDCIEELSLTEQEYESIRRHPDHFLVKPGHVYPEVERVLDDRSADEIRYQVVEKFGKAARVAAERDPRAGS